MTNEALKLAVSKFPTLKAFAEALSEIDRPVTYQMVQQWMVGSVPAEYCPAIEDICNREVSRIALRPKDGRRIWPELVEPKAGRRITDKNQ